MGFFFNLSSVDKKKIREAVTLELDRYRILKYIENLNENQEAYCQRIDKAIGELPCIERDLIVIRYLDTNSEYITDQQVYRLMMDPPISATTYSEIRDSAMIKISLSLNINPGVSIDYLISKGN